MLLSYALVEIGSVFKGWLRLHNRILSKQEYIKLIEFQIDLIAYNIKLIIFTIYCSFLINCLDNNQ